VTRRYFISFAIDFRNCSSFDSSRWVALSNWCSPVVVLLEEVVIDEALEATSVRGEEKIDGAVIFHQYWLRRNTLFGLPMVVAGSVGDRLKILEPVRERFRSWTKAKLRVIFVVSDLSKPNSCSNIASGNSLC
jgi:hypothetical protein